MADHHQASKSDKEDPGIFADLSLGFSSMNFKQNRKYKGGKAFQPLIITYELKRKIVVT